MEARKKAIAMLAILSVIMTATLVFLVIVYRNSSPGVLAKSTIGQTVNLELGTTIGNHTYLPFNLDKTNAGNRAQEVLQVLDAFERAHPEWEITSWNVEEDEGYFYGIWINHRPKEE